MDDARLQALYAMARARRRHDAPCDVTPEAMVDLLEGRGTKHERRQTMEAIVADPRCREELALLRAMVRAGPSVQRRRFSPVLAAAATIALAVSGSLLWRAQRTEAPVTRGVAGAMQTITPDGAHSGAGDIPLIWHPLAGANGYKVVVVDRDGARVFAIQTADTTVALPRASITPGTNYHWWVEAETASAGAVRSARRTFRLQP